MRRRITFVQDSNTPFDRKQATLTSDSLTIRDLDALREERLTVSLKELPAELQQLLQEAGKVHIRWATDREADTVAPFSSRVAPGLHVISQDGTDLCPILKVLGVDCSKTSFTSPEHPTEAYYYTLLRSPANLDLLQETICKTSECKDAISKLQSADSIDVNYDTAEDGSQVILSAVWTSPPVKTGWSETIPKPAGPDSQTEVGLFGSNTNTADIQDLKMGGLLAPIGQGDALKPTMFTTPSRHHPLDPDATYSVSFDHPTGLHPTMTISLSREALALPPADKHASSCGLHAHLTLPSTIFADKYQLSTTDPLFLASHRLVALRAVAGETDLEAPDWAVDQWGSNWLLELDASLEDQNQERDQEQGLPSEVNVTVLLHLRYLHPSSSGHRTAEVPWPVVFWACEVDGTKSSLGGNPFDRVQLGWDGLFGGDTLFYQVHPRLGGQGSRLVETIDVPVLDTGLVSSRTVEMGTVVVITLGFAWVLWKLGPSFFGQTKKKEE